MKVLKLLREGRWLVVVVGRSDASMVIDVETFDHVIVKGGSYEEGIAGILRSHPRPRPEPAPIPDPPPEPEIVTDLGPRKRRSRRG